MKEASIHLLQLSLYRLMARLLALQIVDLLLRVLDLLRDNAQCFGTVVLLFIGGRVLPLLLRDPLSEGVLRSAVPQPDKEATVLALLDCAPFLILCALDVSCCCCLEDRGDARTLLRGLLQRLEPLLRLLFLLLKVLQRG